MAAYEVTKGKMFEDGGVTLMARVVNNSAASITQATITGITRKVFDLDSATPDTAVNTATLTVASVVFDTLQADSRWTADSTGYNFRDAPAASIFSTGGHRYRVEYLFDPTSGEDFFVVFELTTLAVRTS